MSRTTRKPNPNVFIHYSLIWEIEVDGVEYYCCDGATVVTNGDVKTAVARLGKREAFKRVLRSRTDGASKEFKFGHPPKKWRRIFERCDRAAANRELRKGVIDPDYEVCIRRKTHLSWEYDY